MDACTKQYQVDEYAMKRIRAAARRLVRRTGIRAGDIGDVQSELTLELLERLPEYDPARSTFGAFVTCVIRRHAMKIQRARMREMRHPGREECSLNEDILDERGRRIERAETMSREHDRRRRGRTDQEKCEMAIDIERMLSRLPRKVRRLCELVKTMTVAEAARRLRLKESTVRSQLAALRESFRDAGLEEYLHRASWFGRSAG